MISLGLVQHSVSTASHAQPRPSAALLCLPSCPSAMFQSYLRSELHWRSSGSEMVWHRSDVVYRSVSIPLPLEIPLDIPIWEIPIPMPIPFPLPIRICIPLPIFGRGYANSPTFLKKR
jgi:hypothetical protein